jgi:hypothetical protein
VKLFLRVNLPLIIPLRQEKGVARFVVEGLSIPLALLKTTVGGTTLTSANINSMQNDELMKKPEVTVYSNPNNGTATVLLSQKAGAVDIILYDLFGRAVKRLNSFQSNTLQLNNLKEGVYFLRVLFH